MSALTCHSEEHIAGCSIRTVVNSALGSIFVGPFRISGLVLDAAGQRPAIGFVLNHRSLFVADLHRPEPDWICMIILISLCFN